MQLINSQIFLDLFTSNRTFDLANHPVVSCALQVQFDGKTFKPIREFIYCT